MQLAIFGTEPKLLQSLELPQAVRGAYCENERPDRQVHLDDPLYRKPGADTGSLPGGLLGPASSYVRAPAV